MTPKTKSMRPATEEEKIIAKSAYEMGLENGITKAHQDILKEMDGVLLDDYANGSKFDATETIDNLKERIAKLQGELK